MKQQDPNRTNPFRVVEPELYRINYENLKNNSYKINVVVGDVFDGDMNLPNFNYQLKYKDDVLILLNVNVNTGFHSQGYMGNPYLELEILCVFKEWL